MKVDRVIFCLNNNPVYTGFWNPFSRAWRKKYDILPTLMFVGTQEELASNNLSEEYGEIYRLDPVKEVIVDPSLDWSTTWALFYGASMFKQQVSLTMGIDQLVLTNDIFDFLLESKERVEDKYIIALADAYKDLPGIYPSSWHIASGANYKEIYNIDDDWRTEVTKVFSQRKKYPRLPSNFWALDEAYSSDLVNQYIEKKDNEKILFMNIFHKLWRPRRLDRGGVLKYNRSSLQSGEYSEIHSPRPYEEYEEYFSKLISDLLGE